MCTRCFTKCACTEGGLLLSVVLSLSPQKSCMLVPLLSHNLAKRSEPISLRVLTQLAVFEGADGKARLRGDVKYEIDVGNARSLRD